MTYAEAYEAEYARWEIHCCSNTKYVVMNFHACMLGDDGGLKLGARLICMYFTRKTFESFAAATAFVESRATTAANKATQ